MGRNLSIKWYALFTMVKVVFEWVDNILCMEYSFGMKDEAKNIWNAMQGVFADGFSTADLSKPGGDVKMIATNEFGDKVAEKLLGL